MYCSSKEQIWLILESAKQLTSGSTLPGISKDTSEFLVILEVRLIHYYLYSSIKFKPLEVWYGLQYSPNTNIISVDA